MIRKAFNPKRISWLWIQIVFVLLLFTHSCSGAEDELTSGEIKINLNLPEILKEYEVIVKEPSGKRVDRGTVSSTGQTVLNLSREKDEYILTLNTNEITPLSENIWTRLPLVEIGITFFLILALCSAGAYYIGFLKARQVLNILRDYLYDEDLD